MSPFRIITDIERALVTTDYLRVIFETDFLVNGPIQCTLRSITNDFQLPILTKCSYSSKSYTMYPLSGVPIGRYMIVIATYHNDFITADGITFPANTNRVPVKVTLFNSAGFGTTTSIDRTHFAMIAGNTLQSLLLICSRSFQCYFNQSSKKPSRGYKFSI